MTVVRPSGVETAMTGGLDTTSDSVDKQSIEVWNEVLVLSFLMQSNTFGILAAGI